ncbi:hypothetical protein BD324DRAFT_121250 [Kockovaella imperatae]|uniref:RRM domain-containing protein n=1 Tax=Kockovaella imperatae TaxID=4999 RepID=A0A1Y1UCE0_9TREE|nr:hypothetical protein BD324DRAFT_121250 [Kockovaella imperatae]ORX35166.1 hypothetical protein BD324DRAFT_121250 [Kockovaella imperatae]
MSQLHLPDPHRAPSAASHISSSSHRDKMDGMSNGSAGPGQVGESHDPYSHSTPLAPLPSMASSSNPALFSNINPAAYLPQVTSSPPPHVPTYIPPPQHAMAPDPIHDGHMAGGGPSMMPWSGAQPSLSHPWAQSNGYGAMPPPPPRGMMQGQAARLPQNGPSGMPLSPTEPYPSRGSVPLGAYSQHAMMGLGGRPGSGHGDGRDRRRDRHRDEQDRDERDSREDEVITTIFVVGFPDDMGEREFQNIFTFSPGFEAATLKFPSGSRREPAAALLAELSQIAANQQAAAAAAGEHYEIPPTQPALEEALAALQMGGTASTSSSTTPSAAMSMTPSAPSGATFGSSVLPQLPSRRQTIGFARFRTRADALAAKEHLQGRKIDTLTGATLKAEMAKKNLHQKRATSGEELVGLLLRSGRLAGLMNPSATAAAAAAAATGSGSAAQMLGIGVQGQPTAVPGPSSHIMGPPPMPNHPSGHPHSSAATARDAWNSWPGQQQAPSDDRYPQPGSFVYPNSLSTSMPSHQQPSQQPPSSQSNASTSPPLSVKSPNARPTDSKALLALAEEADELEDWPLSGTATMGMGMDGFDQNNANHGHSSGINGPNSESAASRSRERSSTSSHAGDPNLAFSPISNHPSVNLMDASGNMRVHPNQYAPYGRADGATSVGDAAMASSPPGGSDRLSEGGRMLGGNPADQNPPINTLYVGNLPAISPPTHPPNFLEESLRGLFCRCPGYKRMSFRQKINGPMCFVEFEEVAFASQAIKELYGHNLGGLVKGGIRLSYSKNSLGQRGNGHPSSGNPTMFGGIAHTVALAGMSPSSSAKHLHGASAAPPSSATTHSFGLQLSNGSSSSPIPMPDLRRGSEAVTALSPTAQPFSLGTSANSAASATSPRARYFGSSPSGHSGHSASANDQAYSYASSAHSNGGGSTGGNTTGGPNATSAVGGQFSPVSPPIRTPASFAWVSSGQGNGTAVGNGGYGFNATPWSSTTM